MNPNNNKLDKRTRRATDLVATEVDQVAICKRCDCDMVYPIDWEQADGPHWRVTLRCPNCEDVFPGLMDEDLIEQFDCLLDRGTDSVVRDLRNLTYANMATEINSFIGALEDGLILPEDF